MNEETNYPIDLIDQAEGKNSPIAAELERAGRSLRVFASYDELAASENTSKRPVLVWSVQKINNEALAKLGKAKAARPGRLLVCAVPGFRETKRLRLLEAGADEVLPTEAGGLESLGGLLVCYTPAREPEKVTAAEPAAKGETDTAAAPGQMFFQLGEGELSNALQFLCMSPRVGRLDITFSENGEKGKIYLSGQTVVHVTQGDLKGVQAMAAIIGMPGQRKAVFYEGEKAPEETNSQPLSQFLLEASVMADEIRAGNM